MFPPRSAVRASADRKTAPGGLLAWLLARPRALVAILLVNLGGTVWGFIWYREQLAATPWYFWPFTPECPIQSLLFAAVIALRLLARPWPFLEAFTLPGLIKYGTWTVGILGHHWATGGVPDLEGVALFVAHLGMAVEGLVFLPLLVPARYLVLLVGPWFALMDWLDYGVGLHPYLPGGDQMGVATGLAAAGSIAVTLYTLTWLRSAPTVRTRRGRRARTPGRPQGR
ncbi:MAG: DUF1405 domain-containing protein [Bacillota bacterium]|nr:DUF1405 domain-containing protein [Bacillota bacterium]